MEEPSVVQVLIGYIGVIILCSAVPTIVFGLLLIIGRGIFKSSKPNVTPKPLSPLDPEYGRMVQASEYLGAGIWPTAVDFIIEVNPGTVFGWYNDNEEFKKSIVYGNNSVSDDDLKPLAVRYLAYGLSSRFVAYILGKESIISWYKDEDFQKEISNYRIKLDGRMLQLTAVDKFSHYNITNSSVDQELGLTKGTVESWRKDDEEINYYISKWEQFNAPEIDDSDEWEKRQAYKDQHMWED